jgi:transposase
VTKNDVILKVFEGKITQLQGADILGYSARHMRRLMRRYDKDGYDGLRDQRGKVPRRTRIKPEVITEVIRLKREQYADFNVAHFHEKLTEEHGIKLSYSWTKVVLQEAKLVDKAPGRGKYRRKRDRRPMRGMMLHFDGSTHEWIPGLPMWDLMWLMDDATSEVLYAGPEACVANQRTVLRAVHRSGQSLLPHKRGREQAGRGAERASAQSARHPWNKAHSWL